MKINETTLNCCKPKRFNTFTGADSSDTQERKIRAKHFYQMNDETLQLRSLLKAHKDVERSGKMRAFKALPAVTTGLLGLTIGLAQPGKLANKAAAGLGFLALSGVISNISSKIIDKVQQNKQENKKITAKDILTTTAKIAVGAGTVAASALAVKNTKAFKKTSEFIAKEAMQLSDEINKTKLGNFFENTITPFAKKHASKFSVLSNIAPIGIIIGSSLAEIKLMDSLSNDIKEKTIENYKKGKMVQAIAREHYDSVDAPEIE